MIVTKKNCFWCQREIIVSIFQWISKTKIMTKFIFTRLFPRTGFARVMIWLIIVRKVLTIFRWYFMDQKLYPRDWKNFTDERHTNRNGSVTWCSWNSTHDNSLECMRSSFFVIDTKLKSFLKSFIFASSRNIHEIMWSYENKFCISIQLKCRSFMKSVHSQSSGSSVVLIMKFPDRITYMIMWTF